MLKQTTGVSRGRWSGGRPTEFFPKITAKPKSSFKTYQIELMIFLYF